MRAFTAFAARVSRHKESFDYLQEHLRKSNKRFTMLLARHTLPIGTRSRGWHINAFARACQQVDLAEALQVRRPNPAAGSMPEGLYGAMQYQAQRETLRWLKQLQRYINTPDCSPSEVLRFVVAELHLPDSCECEPSVLKGNCTLEESWRHKNHSAFNSMVRELLISDSKQRNRLRGAWRSDGEKEAENKIIPPELYEYVGVMLCVSAQYTPKITAWFGNKLVPKDLTLKA